MAMEEQRYPVALTILEHSRNLINGLAPKRLALLIFRSSGGLKAFVALLAEFLKKTLPLWGRGLFLCRKCKRQTSITAGTLFQKTHKPLRTWFLAIWFVTSQKNGVSALGLKRVLGLGGYDTAWTWMHKLRRAMVRPGLGHLCYRSR